MARAGLKPAPMRCNVGEVPRGRPTMGPRSESGKTVMGFLARRFPIAGGNDGYAKVSTGRGLG